jgi:hypothetical protein
MVAATSIAPIAPIVPIAPRVAANTTIVRRRSGT